MPENIKTIVAPPEVPDTATFLPPQAPEAVAVESAVAPPSGDPETFLPPVPEGRQERVERALSRGMTQQEAGELAHDQEWLQQALKESPPLPVRPARILMKRAFRHVVGPRH